MGMKKYYFALLFGLASGALTAFSRQLGMEELYDGFFIYPGLFFAVAAGLVLTTFYNYFEWIKIAGWAVISVAAYNAAFWATFFLALFFSDSKWLGNTEQASVLPAFFVGGMIGAFIMVIGFKLLLVKISMSRVFLLTFVGGLLGMTGVIGDFDSLSYMILFISWQSVMLFLIMGSAEDYWQKQNQVPTPNN